MNEMIKELMPYLQKLADKLDSSAQVLWALQMGQAKVVAISYITQWVMWAVMVVVLYKIWKVIYKKCDGKWESQSKRFTWENDATTLKVFTIISVIITIIYFLFLPSINSVMTVVFNPEYWALHEIIKMVK